MGWELKAFGSDRVTLMTPEPVTGYYGKHGAEAFVRKYGHRRTDGTLYFTGMHRANVECPNTHQTLTVRGFDSVKARIEDVDGGIELLDQSGKVSAGWSFEDLIRHWGRKHASAAYVPYEKRDSKPPNYRYMSPVLLGQGTDFGKYLAAIVAGNVVYDPGSKVTVAGGRPKVKARSQFRTRVSDLGSLYLKFEAVDL
jgi:hypothetical protein